MARHRHEAPSRPAARDDPERDSWRPERGRYRSRDPRPLHHRNARGPSSVRSVVTKTKHERETNPSTRIHSLRNLLSRDVLPMTVRQEKERELAALLLDQQKYLVKQNEKRNLERYHFVRFVERKKAERKLKMLIKERDSSPKSDEASQKKLDRLIHETEVDLNYTLYAPLGQKYISLFVQDERGKERSKMQMNERSYAIPNEELKEEPDNLRDEQSPVARSATGSKPPMWYEVEKYMAEGQAKLEALREGRLTSGNKPSKAFTALGGRDDAALQNTNGQTIEARSPWLGGDGFIDPADLNSGGDEEMSDGGFFER
ncbi:uncharacterized protein Z518_04123 [Rhinocladiella mackenziei CBS 650.93]|uniref:rRNA-processing protein EFG1 n=1 Tax=Rhinocladiella mackenziei CBS 650.93 TaxID=1442369 RepID=A0A0D2IKB9_9EURO|nr:uncharacterized protein Z518_04123 [Rhinocladiella mackenziei CBS 650.93]KIX06149.1 hypothetical protein Z518_04123 [Rhinocladiella mackenziei CBS 650.93]